jgi:hypothetical protein
MADDVETVNLRRKSPFLLAALLGTALIVVLTIVFVIYYQATAPPRETKVCARLKRRLAATPDQEAALADMVRSTFPREVQPTPGEPIVYTGEDPIPDNAENLCVLSLRVWEKLLDRDPYIALVRCVASIPTVDDLFACYRAAVATVVEKH